MVFARSVTALAAGTSPTVKAVARLAAAGGGIPSRIELENTLGRDANGSRPIEPVTSDTGRFPNQAKLLRDFAAMGLGALGLSISHPLSILLEGIVRLGYLRCCAFPGFGKSIRPVILTGGSGADSDRADRKTADQRQRYR